MTGSELKTLTENILDGDTIDDVLFLQLINLAKNRLEQERPWMYLRKLDDTKTASAGNGYNNAIDCPSDWRETWKLYVGEDTQYIQVPFDQQHLYRNSPQHFVVDVANEQYYLLGNISGAQQIYHYYIKTTPDITLSTSPAFPRFHEILAFEVAGYIQMGVDADDVFARMSPENKMQAQLSKEAMTRWDINLQQAEMNKRLSIADTEPSLDLSMM